MYDEMFFLLNKTKNYHKLMKNYNIETRYRSNCEDIEE